MTKLITRTVGFWPSAVVQADSDPTRNNDNGGKRKSRAPYSMQALWGKSSRVDRLWTRSSMRIADYTTIAPIWDSAPQYWAWDKRKRGASTTNVTSDSVPTTETTRVEGVISAIGAHLTSWQAVYGISLVSITVSGGNVTALFSGELPANEKLSVGLTV